MEEMDKYLKKYVKYKKKYIDLVKEIENKKIFPKVKKFIILIHQEIRLMLK